MSSGDRVVETIVSSERKGVKSGSHRGGVKGEVLAQEASSLSHRFENLALESREGPDRESVPHHRAKGRGGRPRNDNVATAGASDPAPKRHVDASREPTDGTSREQPSATQPSPSGGAHGQRDRRRQGRGGAARHDKYDKDEDYSGGGGGGLAYPPGKGMSKLKVPRVNTETFVASHEPVGMRIVVDVASARRSVRLTVRDVLYAPCVFNRPGDERLYDQLVGEIRHCHVPEATLLKSWHGDSHWIADDSTGWKRDCPTFTAVVKRLQDFLGMTVNATRFNWYTDTSEWKPFHHDAAAVKPHMAKTQNFTAAVSFGATRDAAFENAATKVVVSMPQPNGSIYCFSRDTNILWRHGILQEKEVRQEGRISIIAWGWVDQDEVDE
jgi:hypothetical protein